MEPAIIDQISVLILAVAMFGFTVIAMKCDLKTRRLPNWLTVSTFAAGILFHLIIGFVRDGATGGLAGLGFSMGGFAVGFSILFVLWLIGGGGGGDVKFAGAVGAWLGAATMFIAFIASAVFALMLAAGTILWRVWTTKRSDGPKLKKAFAAGQRVPYAVPLTLGTWCVIALKLISVVGVPHS